jgi:hypothetical protein
MPERRLRENEEAWLGPVAVAVMIDMRWIVEWPMAITRVGLRAARNGYGRDRLPIHVERRPGGTYHWEGRRASIAGGRRG